MQHECDEPRRSPRETSYDWLVAYNGTHHTGPHLNWAQRESWAQLDVRPRGDHRHSGADAHVLDMKNINNPSIAVRVSTISTSEQPALS